METNNENEQVTKRIERPERGDYTFPVTFVLVALVIIVPTIWAYVAWLRISDQSKAEVNSLVLSTATSVLQAAGSGITIALIALWGVVIASWGIVLEIVEFLAHGRIDSPFTVVAICLTVAYVARLRIRRDRLPRRREFTTSQQPQVQPTPIATTTQSWVYFIANHEDSTVKIGYSDDPQRRLSDLQVGNHSRLEILATVPGGQEVEQMLHNHFASHRINGEWFDLDGDLDDYVQRLRNGR